MKPTDGAAVLMALFGGLIGYACFSGCGSSLVNILPALLALVLACHSVVSLRGASAEALGGKRSFAELDCLGAANAIVSNHSFVLSLYVPIGAPSNWKSFDVRRPKDRLGSLVTSAASIGMVVALLFFAVVFIEPIESGSGRFSQLVRGSPVHSAVSVSLAALLLWSTSTYAALSALANWRKK